MHSTMDTLRGLPARPALALFLLANFLAVDSLNAMIQWVAQFFRVGWGITNENTVTEMLIRLSIAAVISGFVAGRAADLFGAGRVFAAATLSLLVLTLVDAFGTNREVALHVTVWCGGFGAAGVWLTGRRVLVDLVPADRLAQHMGLLGITRKASVIGTLLLAGLADTLGWRTAIGALAIPLALSLVFLALAARRPPDPRPQTVSR
jgi:MFS-type transporter involved in bile tolerance (Atg22 family)